MGETELYESNNYSSSFQCPNQSLKATRINCKGFSKVSFGSVSENQPVTGQMDSWHVKAAVVLMCNLTL